MTCLKSMQSVHLPTAIKNEEESMKENKTNKKTTKTPVVISGYGKERYSCAGARPRRHSDRFRR